MFNSSVTAEYAATIRPGGTGNTISSITAGTLNLKFGSRVVLDIAGTGETANDRLLIGTLSTEKKSGDAWTNYGPGYLAPVFQFNPITWLPEGCYPIGTVETLANGSSLSDIVLEGLSAYSYLNPHLLLQDGTLYLILGNASPNTGNNNNNSTTTETGNVTYALQNGNTFNSGQTVNISNNGTQVATITYGENGGASFSAATAYGLNPFSAFTPGNGVNGNKPGGTFYTIVPAYDGTIEVAVVLNAGKPFYILEDGTALSGFNGITKPSKYYGTFTFDVQAGKSYKIYCSGSKLGFFGFNYEYTITTTNNNNQNNSFSYSWNFSNWASGDYTSNTTVDGLTLKATSDRKVSVDAQSAYVNGINYTKRLKFGGSGSSNYRNLQFTVPGSCTITVVAAHAGSGANRTLRIATGSFNNVVGSVSLAAYASPTSYTYTYSGDETTVYVYSANSGINVYAIYVESISGANVGEFDMTDGISTMPVNRPTTGQAYNLSGMRVDYSYKGVVIIDGKKVLRK